MERTVLIYIEDKNRFLMLNRNKRTIDFNKGKWIGIGGHIEENETELDAAKREAFEETGLILENIILCGVVTFHNIDHDEEMTIYLCDKFSGILHECDEGSLAWIDKNKIFELNLWEGDKVYLIPILENKFGFKCELYYNNDKLIGSEINYEI